MSDPDLLRISAIVCAYNEEGYLPGCLYSLLAQTRPLDEIIVVNNGSTDGTADAVKRFDAVTIVDEPRKGLVQARETGYRRATGDLLWFLDADTRAPAWWIERIERRFAARPRLAAISAACRYYDWDVTGRVLLHAYHYTVSPATQFIVQHVFRAGAVFYGGSFCVRRRGLDAVGGFDTCIDFHGEDTNLGRRLARVGRVDVSRQCYVLTSARRFKAMGRGHVLWLYIRNFLWETIRHRPRDTTHADVRGTTLMGQQENGRAST